MERSTSVTKALQNVENRYLLVNAIMERVKIMKGKLTVSENESDGDLINIVLKEIAEGKIKVIEKEEKLSDTSDDDENNDDSLVA